jgi:hypothetical protein
MEDAFTESLLLMLLSVVAFAYAKLRRVWQAERSFADSHRATGMQARIDAVRANAFAAPADTRSTGRQVERWLVRVARRSAAAPPGDEADRFTALALLSVFPSPFRRRPSCVGI